MAIDCAVAPGGRVLEFEVSATMNFLPFSDNPSFAYMEPLIDEGPTAMLRLIYSCIGRQVCDQLSVLPRKKHQASINLVSRCRLWAVLVERAP